ncbi:ABC transporter substrate-binding protein [Actinoplanes xinjiangensis]|uniref:Putative spermidine/putrescine transport system substrate-binding protein n=1 Tax=Actinoplanes xinjiangensis TaxID=512350 RepID=A0A316FW16_9ACTN|nr:ABC transporter substrate-binding protein [Actinoplanes xinjiangensis]PWK52285.1 putative spermidine/putrescine transport system substrate-binding protein [Actinoplanes xinjiangensis]GIF37014.1 ABC transporter substrate-binding protein [Actinoplanes xinjiangensis]
MRTTLARSAVTTLTAAAMIAFAGACSPPEKESEAATSKAGTATSAADLGGLDALIAEAKKEGQLNVIALPPDWANYGEIIKAFGTKYGIKVNSAQPDGNSQDEINAATQLKGQDTAPDVFDLGVSVATANTAMFAPYKVEKFADIPDGLKDANGTWVNDYGGYMSIGYDSAKVPAPTSVADLLKAEYKGKVALNGDPTQAGAAFGGVQMASLANGGTVEDITKGVQFFADLKKAGNFLPVDPTSATIESGQTPVVFDWDYLNAAQSKKLPTWKVFVPSDAVLGSYYVQAINKDAPHPAAARLWQEFLYSDEGQNLWLKGGARPVRADAMQKAGTIDATAFAALPAVEGTPVIPTEAQSTKAKEYLTANWAKAIG